jgi:thymidylate synthase (FAD)
MAIDEQQLSEINDNRQQKAQTARATVEAMEEILYKPIKVLDHGFVRVVDYMGDDSSIVQSARVSYGAGTKKISLDRGLIQYLIRHKHTTPFEMCEIKFHIKLPMFIARQWIRHRTANVNEYSARYSILGKDFYLPERDQLAVQSLTNRQGRDAEVLNDAEAARVLEMLKGDALQCYAHYEEMLNEDMEGNVVDESRAKLARELARMNLPVNFYTEWYWKIDLHNLLHFLHLRADPHAQYEIRVYAQAMLDIVKKWVPLTYEAFMEYSVNGTNLSNNAMNVIKQMLKGKKVTQEESGMSKREWGELMETLGE